MNKLVITIIAWTLLGKVSLFTTVLIDKLVTTKNQTTRTFLRIAIFLVVFIILLSVFYLIIGLFVFTDNIHGSE